MTVSTNPPPQIERVYFSGVPGYQLSTSGPALLWGTGDPNTAVSGGPVVAPQGSLYLRVDGSTSTSLYVATASGTWTAK